MPSAPTPRTDQRVVLVGVSWEQYAGLVKSVGEAPALRMTYLDGTLEIMTTSPEHEFDKKLIARLVEAYADEQQLPLIGCGNATWKRKARNAGLEADECYFFEHVGSRPDLAIEVVKTSGSVDKLAVYQRLRIPEVWFWLKGRFHVFLLGSAGYEPSPTSRFLPGLDLAALAEIVSTTGLEDQHLAVRSFRASLR